MSDIEQKIHDLFTEVVNRPPSEWPAFLDAHCESTEVREKVEALLKQHDQSADFLEKSATATYPHLISPFGDEIDEFKIIREIGRGGMGKVYLAEDNILQRRVALKIVTHVKEEGEVADRFRREARAAARLVNPGIVQVYRAGEGKGFSFIAMEFVDGVTLADYLESQKVIERRTDPKRFIEVAKLIQQVSDSLDFAHRNSVIHRDVKPSNILIDSNGVARLSDFGIARILSEPTYRDSGTIIGSLKYMSPEQAKVCDSKVDHRTDLFSLGIVLYEASSFQRPFEGANYPDIFKALADGRPTYLRKVNPSIPVDLATICHKAMESELAHRYQTAAHMSADLRCFIEGRPILARSPSLGRRIRYWCSNHQVSLLAMFSAVIFLALIALIGVYTELQRAKMGRMIVAEAHRGFSVTAVRMGDDLSPEEPIQLGEAPLTAYLKPGIYRVIIGSGEKLFETTSIVDAMSSDLIKVDKPVRGQSLSMVHIPSGRYSLGNPGSTYLLSAPRTVDHEGFFISPTEVSNREYHEYIVETNRRSPETWAVPYDHALDPLPVTDVSWDEANEYCRWKGVRLPTPTEWEIASRGPEGAAYPWGPALSPSIQRQEAPGSDRDNYLRFARPVNSDRHLATPLGVMHMLSNVEEYTEGIAADRNRGLVIKGRSWCDSPFRTPADVVILSGRSLRAHDRGFRVAVSERKEN